MPKAEDGPILLEPGFQHYAWGDRAFIPRLYGLPAGDQPFAEAWIGAHPALPALAHLAGGAKIPLDALIAERPLALLGAQASARFGGLPYLAKIIAAAQPLSIQTHPTRPQAMAGFRREEAAGVPRGAPTRNYRDPNPKPELLIALTPFHALCGFRAPEGIAAALAEAVEIAPLLPGWQGTPASLKELVTAFLALPDQVLLPALARWLERLRAAAPPAGTSLRWVVEADGVFSRPGRPDRGLFFMVLLNLIELAPWQALFLPAGVPHAYLRGAGLEVMANSDNVLRAGLTPKHVDARELVAIVRFDSDATNRVDPVAGPDGTVSYPTPAEEFAVSYLDVGPASSLGQRVARGPELLLFLGSQPGASLRVEAAAGAIELADAGSCLIPDGVSYGARATAPGRLVRISLPPPPAVGAAPSVPRLAFGTSGLRGLVSEISDFEAYVNTRGFLDYLTEVGDVRPGSPVALAGDLRPSTDSPDRSIMRAVARAIADAGFDVVNCGRIPTPALASYAFAQGWPSVMVTGSHIPFDRNGIKFNKSRGEVLKTDEAPILAAVEAVRLAELRAAGARSLFGAGGMFRAPAPSLPPVRAEARALYLRRYRDFFPAGALAGLRVVVYQHSAVGRELLAELLRDLGAEVYPMGASQGFVAIDTEAIAEERLQEIQALADEAHRRFGPIDVVVSTDGDSDRPMVLGIDAGGRARFFGGDELGMVVADYLGADTVAVPVTSSDAIDRRLGERGVRLVRTRVGSPFVVAAMLDAPGRARVGWEANGGFLTFSEMERGGRRLAPLPTRDALLPIAAVLHAAGERGLRLEALFAELPRRFSRASLLDGVSLAATRALAARHAVESGVTAADLSRPLVLAVRAGGQPFEATGALRARLELLRADVARHFNAARGFGPAVRFELVDGLRIVFANGDVAHVRPSGNAPQLRIYAMASSEERADAIIALALHGPDALLPALLAEALAEAPADAP
jgi:phosphomannomutase